MLFNVKIACVPSTYCHDPWPGGGGHQMTLEKFEKLSVAFMEVGCRDPEVVSGVIDMIVDKAQMEHHFSRCMLHGLRLKFCMEFR